MIASTSLIHLFSTSVSAETTNNAAVYLWDIGQGDSTLIATDQKNILIDGGPKSESGALLNYLWKANITNLDFIIATHPHEDHIGGLPAVMTSNITVCTVIYNGQNSTSQIFQQFYNLARSHNLTVADRNQVCILTTTTNFTILNPTQPFNLPDDDFNTNSIVLKLQVGNVSFLFTGDARAETEQNMISSGLNLQSNVLKVAHHGSRTSTSQTFLDAVNPKYAVISAGLNNTYGHPHIETMQRLVDKGVIVCSTYSSGTVIFNTDGLSLTRLEYPGTIPEFTQTITTAVIASIVFLTVTFFKLKKSSVKKKCNEK
jgi:competence protein ComEC